MSAARIPDGTRKIAPMLGIGMCKKIGPGRHPGCSHCWPDDACTSASYPGRRARRCPGGYAGTEQYTRRGSSPRSAS
jgi:hypothetical protein